MNIIELREAVDKNLVVGTTCGNCMFTQNQESEKITKDELNKFGGITPEDPAARKRFKTADVITMPGEKFPTTKHMCSNKQVRHWVTERMCCNLWEHPGLIREFDGKEPAL